MTSNVCGKQVLDPWSTELSKSNFVDYLRCLDPNQNLMIHKYLRPLIILFVHGIFADHVRKFDGSTEHGILFFFSLVATSCFWVSGSIMDLFFWGFIQHVQSTCKIYLNIRDLSRVILYWFDTPAVHGKNIFRSVDNINKLYHSPK